MADDQESEALKKAQGNETLFSLTISLEDAMLIATALRFAFNKHSATSPIQQNLQAIATEINEGIGRVDPILKQILERRWTEGEHDDTRG